MEKIVWFVLIAVAFILMFASWLWIDYIIDRGFKGLKFAGTFTGCVMLNVLAFEIIKFAVLLG